MVILNIFTNQTITSLTPLQNILVNPKRNITKINFEKYFRMFWIINCRNVAKGGLHNKDIIDSHNKV